MTTPHFLQLAAFMGKGGILDIEKGSPAVMPESLNVEEFYNQSIGGTKDYQVNYFEFYGRGSAMSFMLQKANASWEKKTLTFPEWGALKKTQGGGLPFVVINGKNY